MATRDRSQGFSFVLGDVKEMLSQLAGLDDAHVETPPAAAVVNMNKDTDTNPALVPNAPVPVVANPETEKAKAGLDKLQNLHQQIHIILEELNQLSSRKKRK